MDSLCIKSQTATSLWPSGFSALLIVSTAYREAAGIGSAAICAHIDFDELALSARRNIKLNIVAAAHPKGPRHILRSYGNLDIFRFPASGQACTYPAFWRLARVCRKFETARGGGGPQKMKPLIWDKKAARGAAPNREPSATYGPSGPRRFCGVRAFCRR